MLLRRLAVTSSAATAFYLHRRSKLPNSFVLEIEAPADASAHLRTVNTLTDAATDPRVRGLVCKLGGARLSLAQAQELGDAVKRFRASKASAAPTFAYAPEYGASADYLLACACATIVQQPGGLLRLPAVSLELPNLGEMLARGSGGVRPVRIASGEAASGGVATASPWAERAPTAAQVRNAEELVAGSYEQLVQGISSGRGMREWHVRRLTEFSWYGWLFGGRGATFFSAADAEKRGLIDASLYEDAFVRMVESACGASATANLTRYREAQRTADAFDAAVASGKHGIDLAVGLLAGAGLGGLVTFFKGASSTASSR